MCSDVMCPGCWAQRVSTLSGPGAPWTLILGTQNHTGCTQQLRGVLHTLISLSSCWDIDPEMHTGNFQAFQKIARESPYLPSSSNIKVEKEVGPAVA